MLATLQRIDDRQSPFEISLAVEQMCPVRLALQQTPQLGGCALSWLLHEGLLVLRGRVGTFYQKQIAQSVTIRLAGVERVLNEIEVDPDYPVPPH